jgi:chromosome segregation ATPase
MGAKMKKLHGQIQILEELHNEIHCRQDGMEEALESVNVRADELEEDCERLDKQLPKANEEMEAWMEENMSDKVAKYAKAWLKENMEDMVNGCLDDWMKCNMASTNIADDGKDKTKTELQNLVEDMVKSRMSEITKKVCDIFNH